MHRLVVAGRHVSEHPIRLFRLRAARGATQPPARRSAALGHPRNGSAPRSSTKQNSNDATGSTNGSSFDSFQSGRETNAGIGVISCHFVYSSTAVALMPIVSILYYIIYSIQHVTANVFRVTVTVRNLFGT